jgi:hypothetical protein
MKLCLNVNDEVLTGYNNLGFLRNVDAYAEDGECDEILSTDILSYIHYSKVEDFIRHLAKKVKRGGKIILGGNDCVEISKMFFRGDFNIAEYNRITFGDANSRQKENAITIPVVVDVLQSMNFKIMKKRIDNYQFVVEAVRL